MMQRVAVTVFRGMVSPRLDAAEDIWIYEIENGNIRRDSVYQVDTEHPVQVAEFLQKDNVGTIICGGCPSYYMNVFVCFGLIVYPGLDGEPDLVIERYMSGDFPEPLHIQNALKCRYRQEWNKYERPLKGRNKTN